MVPIRTGLRHLTDPDTPASVHFSSLSVPPDTVHVGGNQERYGGSYVWNMYNGMGPTDTAANGVMVQRRASIRRRKVPKNDQRVALNVHARQSRHTNCIAGM